jgi:hypothetical protein
MRQWWLIPAAVLSGLASFALQARTLFYASSGPHVPLWPYALLFAALWFGLAVVAATRLERRRWWAFAPAPLVLLTPLFLGYILAACTVTDCSDF